MINKPLLKTWTGMGSSFALTSEEWVYIRAMTYIKLVVEKRSEQDGDLIAGLLTSIENRGSEESETQVFVYFDEGRFDENAVMEALTPFGFQYTVDKIPHENWNLEWESNFEPIRIHQEVGIRASFHPPFTDCKHDIVITPKMSFGTGHHETTQMMLEYGCETDFKGKSVLDFGSGTGVLAILASLEGASRVLGIDHEPWSVENAKENCLRNACHDIEISDLSPGDLSEQFDIILANINLNVLLEFMPDLKRILSKNGDIYLSGILISDLPTISKSFSSLGFKLVSTKQKKDWIAIHIN